MRRNKIVILINKPLPEVFQFTITPPNSTLWIPSIVHEETNVWPVRKGTKYILRNKKSEISEVKVTKFIKNKLIEWISEDQNYHCRYKYISIDNMHTQLEYSEWMDKGDIKAPFTKEILGKLKYTIEKM